MKKLKLTVALLLFTYWVLAQTKQDKNSIHNNSKPPLDHSVYDKWPEVRNVKISNNGEYAMYTIFNIPLRSSTLVIQSLNKTWKKEFAGTAGADFTQDSRRAVFKLPGDSLCLLELGTDVRSYILHAVSYKITGEGGAECLTYRLNTPLNGLAIRNLNTGGELQFTDVTDYLLSDNGKVLLLETVKEKDSTVIHTLEWVDPLNGKIKTIWKGKKASNYVFDAAATQLAFIVEETKSNQTAYSLWQYKEGMKEARELINNQAPGVGDSLTISDFYAPRFSKDGTKIFFGLRQVNNTKVNPNIVKVDVWNYRDVALQSLQLNEINLPLRPLWAVINMNTSRIIQLEKSGEEIMWFNTEKEGNKFLLLTNRTGDIEEWNWNLASHPSVYLINTNDGSRRLLEEKLVEPSIHFSVSPQGKYILWYNSKKKTYLSYEVATGITRNITSNITTSWDYHTSSTWAISVPIGIAAWLNDDSSVLIYDNNDIWQVDPSSENPPVNITSGYGKNHNIIFRLIKSYSGRTLARNEKLVLNAFNKETKDNGFFSLEIGQKTKPKLLTMGPYFYNAVLKAKDTRLYLVSRESSNESPNFFWTDDFKKFNAISRIKPHEYNNWLTTELISWKSFDGRKTKGVLYKPEDFDPKKKYPVIFHIYDEFSNNLNKFKKPAAGDDLNIPYFVSNGYLVFTPDIYYKIGEPGESAYSYVVSAAQYLSSFHWVDSTKLGIQGHSFGGFEVNYLVTHTPLFAAAATAAGISDLISFYGSIIRRGNTASSFCEYMVPGIGAALGEKPDLYIKNSPILQAGKVSTPLLLMHNKNDVTVPFNQGVGFFTTLRRLGKKVWMLQYDGEGHTIGGKAAMDYSLRLAQFFDHYLKNKPAPQWMAEGIPARLKGIVSGLYLNDDRP